MEQYHGTNSISANLISSGKIDVNIGGGELGKGFYTGDLKFQAFIWAWHQYKQDKSVVILNFNDDDFLQLKPLCLNLLETQGHRRHIRYTGKTRTFEFNQNVVWAPVVGRECQNFNQIKFESLASQAFLNDVNVNKFIL
jgi:hypothetical protein